MPSVDPETAELLEHQAGHYLRAVAVNLLEEGVPVADISVARRFVSSDRLSALAALGMAHETSWRHSIAIS